MSSEETITGYSLNNVAIATIGSHSALQIIHGAQQEGFRTVLICTQERAKLYSSYPLAKPDRLIVVDRFSDLLTDSVQEELLAENAVLIPHGSFVEYVGAQAILDRLRVPVFGNKAVLTWETERHKQREWLITAGVPVPREYPDLAAVDGPVIAKLSGAKGGAGLVSAANREELRQRVDPKMIDHYTFQEYLIGTRYYPHYFYSRMRSRVEILGFDRRDETNIDELYRYREFLDKSPSYVVVGNRPLVVRESLLPQLLADAEGLISSSQQLFSPGLIGPFCLEMVCQDDMKFVAVELSARIVAGTNLYPAGSPYSRYYFAGEMSTGRRIALEIKESLQQGRLTEIIS